MNISTSGGPAKQRSESSSASIPRFARAYWTDLVIPSTVSKTVPSKSNRIYLYMKSLLCLIEI